MDNMNAAPGAGKVIRAPSLKRGKNDETRISDRVKLERVLGLTVSSNAALDCDPETEVVAYPAGCTVVLFNPKKNRQTHLLNSSRKTITCLAFSAGGRYLVTGECGHLPSVRVWDLQEGGGTQIAEFPGHKYGINCVAFSPSHKYVVSVGSQHDMIVNVWDWRSNVKVASNKVSAKVKAVSFAENGNYFVTVGNRHVKFWYLEYSRSAKYKEPVPLMGRSAILGEQRNNYFCDVSCGRGEMGDSTYAITKSGLLCEFNNRRLLDKWVELRTTSANCMAVGENFIFIGCAEGIVRCFSPATLQFVTTLPRTHYLGVDVAQGLNISHMATHPNNAKYPDAVALAFDHTNLKLTCVYNDHSLYVWDVRDIKRVGKSHSFLFHSACIWGVEMFPPMEHEGGSAIAAMPPGSFVTCSSDDTIRVWNLDSNLPPDNDTMYKRNIYSNELLKVLYVDPELTYLKDLELSGAGTAEKTDSSYDGRNGVRSIRISPDGKHLASGDRAGNIRIHELKNLQELCRIEAHDAEVLCLEYSRHESGHKLLASASRDRLIHVFSVDEEYNFLQTLDDHSSSITAVRFLNTHDQLQMVSCGADKSIIFRQLQGTPGGTQCQFARGHNIAGKTTLYDMEVDSGQKHILTACQDRNIRVYNVSSGKHSKTYKGSVGEDGSLIKVVLDSSGIYSATSCTDKTLCVYDYYSGECMATMFGHSELVTGLRFTNDCRRLVSASGDGCIFIWKVPHDMVVTMHARLAQQAARAGRRIAAQIPNGLHLDNETFGPPPPDFLDPNANSVDQPDYRFSVGQLPLWAKKQMADNSSPPASLANRQMDLPKGRWAQRLDAGGITVKSVYDSDSIIQIPLGQEKRLDSDGSKDSSIDSGTEVRHYADFRRETVIISKQGERDNTDFVPCPESYQELTNGQPTKQVSSSKVTLSRGSDITDLSRSRHLTDDSSIGSYKYEDMESTEHDGDVEDYSEGEGESTEPEQGDRVMYYPPAEETGSDYTVNAMDVEELRRSQRRMKKNQRPERLTDLPLISVSASVSGSQESDEDDDEVSTPSADTAERNLLSMLSVSSTESLDRVGQREKYLKNTFESLSGAEQEATKDAAGTSISSQFLVRANQGGMFSTSTLRNVAVINAAKQTRVDSETSKKREELQRRIEETRRKLQSVGYRSNLKSSQSITDLSQIPEKDGWGPRGVNHVHRYTPAGDSDEGTQASESGGLRRACSLSDLANTAPRKLLHAAPVQVSGKVTNKGSSGSSGGGGAAAGSRTLPRHGLKAGTSSHSSNTNMMRSTSMGMLNQSDSESDLSLAQRSSTAAQSRVNGLMRPTISSQNKVTSLGSKSTASSQNARRRGLTAAYSSVNLSQVGNTNNNEDSSSEETSSVGGKPGIRPRSTSIDRSHTSAPSSLPANGMQPQPQPRRPGGSSLHSRYGSDRDLNRAVPQRSSTAGRQGGSKPIAASRQSQLERSPHELPVKDTDQPSPVYDVVSAPLSQQLCSSIADQLTRTADSVVQLYKRLALEGDQLDQQEMLRGLEEAANEAQQKLRHVGTSAESLKDIVASGAQGDQANVVAMMQQYSDMLLTMVQQRMGSGTAQKPS
ncbi:mitogen-activated protein kinase-binding protein 1-like isoform X3 [Periplaneta americana]|uniref:mitogen-activated protein kinase-binding protein 1-like isoform X3 n=1 Tax=Periplaneta americana TaxID=6978 RepID=UPI0037E833EF